MRLVAKPMTKEEKRVWQRRLNLFPGIPGSEFGTIVCNMVLLCWLELFWRAVW